MTWLWVVQCSLAKCEGELRQLAEVQYSTVPTTSEMTEGYCVKEEEEEQEQGRRGGGLAYAVGGFWW